MYLEAATQCGIIALDMCRFNDEGRRLFPVLERFAYLNAGTLGPLAQPTLDAREERALYDQGNVPAGDRRLLSS